MWVRRGTLRRNLPVKAWGTDIVLPAGTEVIKEKHMHDWAVLSKQLVMKLTGNTWDPEYRWLFVPASEVIEKRP